MQTVEIDEEKYAISGRSSSRDVGESGAPHVVTPSRRLSNLFARHPPTLIFLLLPFPVSSIYMIAIWCGV